MYRKADEKIAKKVALAKIYQDYLKTHGIKKDTWTKAQWDTASPEQREFAKAGISYKRTKKMMKQSKR